MAGDAADELWANVRSAIARADPCKGTAVAFSGGVDSALVAHACADMGLQPVLLTIGTVGSRDMRFAAHIAGLMGIERRALEISPDDIVASSRKVDGIIGECSLSWRENCVAFERVARLASTLGIAQVITANGIDELFCGYDAYRRIAGDEEAIIEMMRAKVDAERRMMRAVSDVAGTHGVRVVQPLLSEEFVAYAMHVPLADKISGSGDLLRKHIVRRAAERAGVPPKSAYSRKKALQYGSGIHAVMRR